MSTALADSSKKRFCDEPYRHRSHQKHASTTNLIAAADGCGRLRTVANSGTTPCGHGPPLINGNPYTRSGNLGLVALPLSQHFSAKIHKQTGASLQKVLSQCSAGLAWARSDLSNCYFQGAGRVKAGAMNGLTTSGAEDSEVTPASPVRDSTSSHGQNVAL